jgi:hypothetical protein
MAMEWTSGDGLPAEDAAPPYRLSIGVRGAWAFVVAGRSRRKGPDSLAGFRGCGAARELMNIWDITNY